MYICTPYYMYNGLFSFRYGLEKDNAILADEKHKPM